MIEKFGEPPNIAEIAKVFPAARKPGVLFTYGDVIYNPSRITIPAALVEHETVHSVQQRATGPKLWWDAYLGDMDFRFMQELEAHRVEIAKATWDFTGRNFRRCYIAMAAERLSSPLYGRMVSKTKAISLLKDAAHIGADHVGH